MNQTEVHDLASRWIAYYNVPENERGRDSPLFTAFTELDDLVRNNPETGWEVIVEIFKLCTTDLQLALLAGGPLESLMSEHGDQFIDRCEGLARYDEKFLYLLTGVWKRNMSSTIWDKLCEITGSAVRRL